LKYGADIDNVDEKGITPLNYVCGDKEVSAEDRTEIVRILIEAGANPNCRDFMEGRTALQVQTVSFVKYPCINCLSSNNLENI
jgi:ankyrin repeat protein